MHSLAFDTIRLMRNIKAGSNAGIHVACGGVARVSVFRAFDVRGVSFALGQTVPLDQVRSSPPTVWSKDEIFGRIG